MVFGCLALIGLWVVAGWWVVAVHPWAGPVLVTVTETNGVHLGDLPAIALGAAVTVYVWRKARTASCRGARRRFGPKRSRSCSV
jgi:hypothetical protein